jgi:tight adherence protein B
MTTALGAVLGTGLFLIWWSFWPAPPRPLRRHKAGAAVRTLLIRAGVERVSATGLVLSCLGVGSFVLLTGLLFTRSIPISACFALFGASFPLAMVKWRAQKRAASLRELWPDTVDHLRSAIRAGLSLPEALIQLGDKGPAELRSAFREFGADYQVSGRFDRSLDRLKARLADPVADSIVEALRMTREVGGSDLGRLLGTLSEFLRDNARTRSELEARQSWTVSAARLAVTAPWIVLLLMSSRPEAVEAYSTPVGASVLAGGLAVSVVCYRTMLKIGALPQDRRVLQ